MKTTLVSTAFVAAMVVFLILAGGAPQSASAQPVVLTDATATVNWTDYGDIYLIPTSINGDYYHNNEGWSAWPYLGYPQAAVFQTASPEAGAEWWFTMYFYHFSQSHKIQYFRISATTSPNPNVATPEADWVVLTPEEVSVYWEGGPLTYTLFSDQKILVSGLDESYSASPCCGGRPAEWRVRAGASISGAITGFRLEVFPYDDDGNGWASIGFQKTTSNGNFALTEFTVEAVESDDDGDGVPNDLDLCPDTPVGETVDEYGCSNDQLFDVMIAVVATLPDAPSGIKNSLITKLDHVRENLAQGNEIVALHQLNAFINQVEAQSGKKLGVEDADFLIEQAMRALVNLIP